ncbi:MAG: VCBS repeat-containing protein [Candidatus Hydrogenedentes bacterium]|nr:VCBS repeat-containing protein [Candidatus Hydrogenedentota bacterium]
MSIVLMLCLSALFDVKTIPLHTPDSHVFLAHADRDSQADVFVLEKGAITVFSSLLDNVRTIPLPDGTTAVDVADLDNDGQTELVVVCGDRILSIRLDAEETPTPHDLFSLHTQLAEQESGSPSSSATPYPFVLTVLRDGKTLLALPCEETFELRTPDGAWTSEPARLRARDGIEGGVSRTVAFEPDLPDELEGAPVHARSFRRGTPSQTRDAALLGQESWPWFPLTLDGRGNMRVLYALAASDFWDTVVRIQGYAGKSVTSPERRYPGRLVALEEDLPDFNHDGYADLLLWSTPDPGMSVGAATRVIAAGTWPVSLSAHLFSPEKGRYEPAAASRVTCAVPIAWFLTPEESGPVRHCVLRDFDGDGRTDLACATAPNRFVVWRYTESGFSPSPDFERSFPEPIAEAAFKADLAGNGKTSLGLRTEHALYVLFATATR